MKNLKYLIGCSVVGLGLLFNNHIFGGLITVANYGDFTEGFCYHTVENTYKYGYSYKAQTDGQVVVKGLSVAIPVPNMGVNVANCINNSDNIGLSNSCTVKAGQTVYIYSNNTLSTIDGQSINNWSEGPFNVKFQRQTCNNPSYFQAFVSSKDPVNSTQVKNSGVALTTAGSGLLHIGIQLMPYAIGLTLIMIIFLLIKRWSNLKTNWQLNRIKRQKIRRERDEIRRYSKNR